MVDKNENENENENKSNNDKMLCPKCQMSGLKSTVHQGQGSHIAPFEIYWDQDGNKHEIKRYMCSRSHYFDFDRKL